MPSLFSRFLVDPAIWKSGERLEKALLGTHGNCSYSELGSLALILGDSGPETVIVTRHPSLITFLKQKGLVPEGAKIIPHVTAAEQVQGKHVVGVVPLRWASLAERVTEVPLDLPQEARGRELSVEEVEAFAKTPQTYIVRRMSRLEGLGTDVRDWFRRARNAFRRSMMLAERAKSPAQVAEAYTVFRLGAKSLTRALEDAQGTTMTKIEFNAMNKAMDHGREAHSVINRLQASLNGVDALGADIRSQWRPGLSKNLLVSSERHLKDAVFKLADGDHQGFSESITLAEDALKRAKDVAPTDRSGASLRHFLNKARQFEASFRLARETARRAGGA